MATRIKPSRFVAPLAGDRKSPTLVRSELVGTLCRSPLHSEELGIRLASRQERQYFLWFLASLLFGARISATIARNTFHSFVRHRLTTPQSILSAGWDFLVNPIMREGGYVRYDGRKSTQVLRDCEKLTTEYGGGLTRLHEVARDSRDLERRLLEFHGIGPVTVNIFLRELRPYWSKADPAPLPRIALLARSLGVDLAGIRRKSMRFARLEAGLIRISRHGERAANGSTDAVRPRNSRRRNDRPGDRLISSSHSMAPRTRPRRSPAGLRASRTR